MEAPGTVWFQGFSIILLVGFSLLTDWSNDEAGNHRPKTEQKHEILEQ